MKRSLLLSRSPSKFADFIAENSDARWNNLRNDHRDVYDDLSAQLIGRQKGLCAFCEIDLKTESGIVAREIEHWRPKRTNPNLTFDVGNLRAACRGGSDRHPASEQYRCGDPQPGPNQSCGSFKGDKDPDLISIEKRPYTPDNFPFSHSVFGVDDDGLIYPLQRHADDNLDNKRLQATIDFLNLNSTRLKRKRAEIKAMINSEIESLLPNDSTESDFESAMDSLAAQYSDLFTEELPIFVTTIRSYFGDVLEKILLSRISWDVGPDAS